MLFFELIQIAIGKRETLSRVPSQEEWGYLYYLAEKQGLIGVLFAAIEKISEKDPAFKPTPEVFYVWLGYANFIEQQNEKVNDAVVRLSEIFENGGFRCCVLKGQGLALLYPQPPKE